jgi:cell division initiation protein
MGMQPHDIRQKQFRIRFRGFDIHEVDGFLEEIAETIQSLKSEVSQSNKQVETLKADNIRYKDREENFRQVMLNSEHVIAEMKKNAQTSARLIVEDAEVKARKILNRAHNRLAQLHEDISELRRQRMQIEIQIRSILETHTKLLDMGKEEMEARDEEDLKVKLLKQG